MVWPFLNKSVILDCNCFLLRGNDRADIVMAYLNARWNKVVFKIKNYVNTMMMGRLKKKYGKSIIHNFPCTLINTSKYIRLVEQLL